MYSKKCRDKVTVMKEEVILTDVYKQGHSMPHRASHIGKRQGWSGGRGSEGEMWARMGKNGQGRINRFKIGCCE